MGAENVPANMEVNYYKWKSWIAALREGDDCVAVKLENAANKLQQNRMSRRRASGAWRRGLWPFRRATRPT